MIAARVFVRPMPNSLLGEDVKFLQSVMWHLNRTYQEEIKRDVAPAPIQEMVSRLSEELFRRRQAGEYQEDVPVVPQKMRRRR